ncbi:MAG: hydrogenase maturation protease [Bacteroidota bacterium]|nr:hydrogenase maturation protease [Bacteroidota bacterium]
MKPILVLCLGNEILSDDAVGPTIANRIKAVYTETKEVEIFFAPVAGFNLLDFFHNRESVLIVDSIITGKVDPGTIHFFNADYLTPSNGLINSHQINLPTAIQFGKLLGYVMPDKIDILAIEVEDITTISDNLTTKVAKSVDVAIEKILFWINTKEKDLVYR